MDYLTGKINATTPIPSTDFRSYSPRFTKAAREANQGMVDLLERIADAEKRYAGADRFGLVVRAKAVHRPDPGHAPSKTGTEGKRRRGERSL